jgi:hypothetical protein
MQLKVQCSRQKLLTQHLAYALFSYVYTDTIWNYGGSVFPTLVSARAHTLPRLLFLFYSICSRLKTEENDVVRRGGGPRAVRLQLYGVWLGLVTAWVAILAARMAG